MCMKAVLKTELIICTFRILQLRIKFHDGLHEKFEYPSEQSLLEDGGDDHYDDGDDDNDHQNNQSSTREVAPEMYQFGADEEEEKEETTAHHVSTSTELKTVPSVGAPSRFSEYFLNAKVMSCR